ncbi:MAG: glycosyltransferase [Rikenellaceae bacterium]
MRILLANKFYYRRGGDCVCTINLEEMLKANGHEVAIFAMQHPENLPSAWSEYFPSEVSFKPGLGLFETLKRPFGSAEVKRKFLQLLGDFQPDVVHLHNIHSQLSPIIGKLAHQKGIKVVWTLHDYKLLCPRYDCLKNGETICEECFTDKSKVKEYKCMKGSTVGSLLAYHEAKSWTRERLEAQTDAFICPSQFMAEKMAQGGFAAAKLQTLCNFIDVEKCRKESYDKGDYYCYIGRLSHEKGVQTLIKVARQLPYRLKIVGGGALEAELRELIGEDSNIELLGHKEWREIKEIVGGARFCVVPSEWYENNPLSVIEAQCLGTPVLGAEIGGIPELIEPGASGMTFASGNATELKAKIEAMFAMKFDYEILAEESQQRYYASAHYEALMKIYRK